MEIKGNTQQVQPSSSTSEKDNSKKEGVKESSVNNKISTGMSVRRGIALMIIAVAAIGIVAVPILQWKKSKRPTLNMQSYAVSSQQDNRIAQFAGDPGSSASGLPEKIEDLKLEALSHYSQAACIKGDTVEATREALKRQLLNVPSEVRDEIVSFAVMEGITTTNARQNMHAANGVLYSSFAWWSTEYTAKALVTSPYSTCVMVSGLEMEAGEEVKGWKTSVRTLGPVIDWKPCHCGLFWCEKCPVQAMEETHSAETMKHQFTLGEQQEVYRWMEQQAVIPALALVGTGEATETPELTQGEEF